METLRKFVTAAFAVAASDKAARSDAGVERDPLTDVLTLRAVWSLLDRDEALREAEIAVFLIDLDGFKEINDRYGHRAGDLVLSQVAARLVAAARTGDLVARSGGDEFVVFSPSVRESELTERERALAVAIGADPVFTGTAEVAIETTVGSAMRRSAGDIFAALRLADQRMYLHKRRAGSDAFDRVSELIVGLLDAGERGIEASLASAVAEVALAGRAYVEANEHVRWWPATEPVDGSSFRELAARARELDEVVEDGQWRLAVPLRGDGAPIGAFVVERAFDFTKADQIALSRAGIALGQALLRLNESATARRRIAELEHLAYRDENTGLANRRELLRRLEAMARDEPLLAVLFVDFDGLRAVNNQLGYEDGNELLRTVAGAIEDSLMSAEFVARLHGSGGDEFIVVCPGHGEAAAATRAADLEQKLSSENLELPRRLAELYGGASVGYALRQGDETPLDLTERAAVLMRSRKATRKSTLLR